MSENPYETPQAAIMDAGAPAIADPELTQAASMLRQTKPWVRFISVLMFICSGFMILGGLFMLVGGAAMTGAGGNPGMAAAGFGAVVGGIYIAMALLYIVPAIFLWRYADQIARFDRDRSSGRLATALEAQKSFWKFVGIAALIMLAVYFVAIGIAIVGGVASSM